LLTRQTGYLKNIWRRGTWSAVASPDDACGLIVLLRMEETVDLAISLEPDLEGSEAVAAPLEEL
jgi:hypothetical protein